MKQCLGQQIQTWQQSQSVKFTAHRIMYLNIKLFTKIKQNTNNTDRYVELQIQQTIKISVMGSTHNSLKRIKLWKNVHNPVICSNPNTFGFAELSQNYCAENDFCKFQTAVHFPCD
jgi:hypothetical protein